MAEAPERLFVQLTPMGGTISYLSSPPDNRKPVYEYIRVDLPRATAADCAYCDSSLGCAEHGDDGELQRLRREFDLSGLGDRPSSMSATKLRRLIQLEQITHAESTPRVTGETTVEAALAERKQVRSVLDMLRRGPKTTACWCTGGFHSPPQHSVACKAAHRLYEHVSETVAQVRAARTEGEGEKS
jgi:hypothetical protein